MPNNINKYYIGIFNKLTCRYLKIKVVTVEGVSEDEIILSDDDAEVIAKFYIQKDTKGSYDVAVYKLPEEWLKEGDDEIKCLLSEYQHYKESNNFDVKQGYEEVVTY